MYNLYEIDGFKIDFFDLTNFNFDKDYSYLERFLTLDEKNEINSFSNKNDKILKLIGRVYPKIKLSKVLNIKPTDIIIEKDSLGKPYYKDYPMYHFSMSGSFPYFAFVLSLNDVGLDLERRRVHDFKALEYVASKEEILEYKDYDDKFMLWTFKEAYGKMLGTGISKELKNVIMSETKVYHHTLFINHVIMTIVAK